MITAHQGHVRYLAALAIFTLAGLGAAWIYVVACPICYKDDEYPAFVAKRELLGSCDLGRIVVLGDSRSDVAIVPALMTVPASNLSINGGGPVEAATITRTLLTCTVLPRLAVVSMDVFHLSQPDPSLWSRSAYFHLLERQELFDLLETATRLGDRSEFAVAGSDGLSDTLRIWLYAARFPSIYLGGLLRGGIFLRYWSNQTALVAARGERGHYFYGHLAESDAVAPDATFTAFRPLPALDYYFDQMLAALDAHGVDVALIAMPVNQPTFEAMSPKVQAEFAAYLVKFQQRYPHVHLVGEPVPHWPSAYFGDKYAHLNRRGAALYSASLDACLRALLDKGFVEPVAGCMLAP